MLAGIGKVGVSLVEQGSVDKIRLDLFLCFSSPRSRHMMEEVTVTEKENEEEDINHNSQKH